MVMRRWLTKVEAARARGAEVWVAAAMAVLTRSALAKAALAVKAVVSREAIAMVVTVMAAVAEGEGSVDKGSWSGSGVDEGSVSDDSSSEVENESKDPRRVDKRFVTGMEGEQ